MPCLRDPPRFTKPSSTRLHGLESPKGPGERDFQEFCLWLGFPTAHSGLSGSSCLDCHLSGPLLGVHKPLSHLCAQASLSAEGPLERTGLPDSSLETVMTPCFHWAALVGKGGRSIHGRVCECVPYCSVSLILTTMIFPSTICLTPPISSIYLFTYLSISLCNLSIIYVHHPPVSLSIHHQSTSVSSLSLPPLSS